MDFTIENAHLILEDYYLSLKEPEPKIDIPVWKCGECNIDKVVQDCFFVCPDCGEMEIDHPIYYDTDYATKVALYKRRLYCMEKLKLYMGHKQCRSPHYKKIVKDLKDHDVQSLIELKDYLKLWKCKKFYKYIYNLYYDVTGVRLINLTMQDADFLARKFVEVESQFKQSYIHKRNNFFNYNSCLYHLMKKYGYKDYKHILLPLNHLKISKVLKKFIL